MSVISADPVKWRVWRHSRRTDSFRYGVSRNVSHECVVGSSKPFLNFKLFLHFSPQEFVIFFKYMIEKYFGNKL